MKSPRIIIRILFLLCFLALPIITPHMVCAQSDVFRHITLRDGLPSGFIWTMMQDSKGFIWMGTNSGLARHDGYNTIAYRANQDDSTSISGPNVLDIIEYDETLFLLATSGGLDLFNPSTETFRRLATAGSNPELTNVSDIHLQNRNTLWAAAENGIYLIDPSTLTNGEPDIEYFGFPPNYTSEGLGRNSLAIDNNDQLWIGTSTTLLKFDTVSREFVDVGPVTEEAQTIIEGTIWSVLFTSGNSLLISSTEGLAILEDGDDQVKAVRQLGELGPETVMGSSFQAITEDPDGNIWLGTGALGAIHWNPASGEAKVYKASNNSGDTISSNDVHLAFEDKDGNIWFGYHYLGASLMYDESWNYNIVTPFPELPGSDPKNLVISVFMDEDGVLYGSTPNGVIINLGQDNQEFVEFDRSEFEGLPEFQVLYILPAATENKLYLYALNNDSPLSSLVIFDKENPENRFSVLEMVDGAKPAPGKGVVHEDHLFVPVYDRDAFLQVNYKTNETDVIELPMQASTSGARLQVSSPVFVNEERLYAQSFWINSSEEVQIEMFIYNLATLEIRPQELTIDYPIENIQAPLVSDYEKGVVYVNSSTGLIRIDNLENSYSVLFEDRMSLLREGSRLMAEDEEGYIWLNNATGLTRLDPLSETIEYFEIPSGEFSAINAYPMLLETGEIIFPGAGAYLRFDPSDLRASQPVGETMIYSLQAGEKTFDLLYSDQSPEIESSQNTLTFSFLGLNFRDPTSVTYRYRILGADNEQWTDVGSQRSVFIPNLPAGNYTFEVQSGSRFGAFNSQTASLSFSVLPPWWNTVPAYLFYLLLIGGVIYAIDRRQRRRLVQQERERAREKELEQAREIEKAYKNLKAAKEQLVQQEKLASLGQLTAGIAHEIKNPLNFVNNFSDLSMELVEESREELSTLSDQVKDEDRKRVDETLEMLNDIEMNLKKIHEHGSRADKIVHSMLQHSRGSDGEMEPTDLNSLIKEYVNLAFHGMRAGKNPFNVEIQLDLDENIEEIPLISEDFSRVILNLCNNAFDAMREKANGKRETADSPIEGGSGDNTPGDYEPKLTVRTHQKNDTVTIQIEDNGPGIPDEIKDKIMQPFFTTKKGTAGTGLGLSITNDIIKAHGGELSIASKENEFTRFTIQLNHKK